MIDLRQLMRERSAEAPPAGSLRYPQIRKRITHRNRRRFGVAATALAVALAIAGGYASLPRATGPEPAATTSPAGVFPRYESGTRLAHEVVAPVALRMATLTWTPSTMDFTVAYKCFGLPGRVAVQGQITINGIPFGDAGCEGPTSFRLSGRQMWDRFGIRLGQPTTITITIDQAVATSDRDRPLPIPVEGTMAAAIYVPVPFDDYPLPPRPATLMPLASWRNCPPEQRTRSDPHDPLKPITLTTLWKDKILIRYHVLTPGFLHLAVDGVEVTSLDFWDYDNPNGTIVWSTTLPSEWENLPGWKNPAQGQPVTVTFTPEHLTGDWQVGIEHTEFAGCP